jgi:glycosyltransferase involved in cell wall biosynthesis
MDVLLIGARPNAQGPIPRLGKWMQDGLEQCGCKVDVVGWGQHQPGEMLLQKIFRRPYDAFEIINWIARREHDVILLNSGHDWRALIRDIPLLLAARWCRMPYILLYHGTIRNSSLTSSKFLYRGLFSWGLRRSAGVFALSKEEEHTVRALCPECSVATVPYPFLGRKLSDERSQRLSGRIKGKVTLAFVARLIEAKGPLVLIRALSVALEKVSCCLVVAGDGPMRERIATLVPNLNLGKHVIMTGQLEHDEVWELLSKADIFILPTWHEEGFPVAILEAMAAGLPIITTRAGGISDWLKEDVNALYVIQQDVNSLAEKIILLCEDASLRERIGNENRILIRRFEPTIVMHEYLKWMETWTGKFNL